MIEPEGGIAGDLDVLALVVADRDLIGVVEQNVGGLQGGVAEEPAADEVLLAFGGLVLELCHPRQLAETDSALHDPAQLVVLGHMALDEHSCEVGVEAHCEEHGGQLNRSLTDDPWFVGHGERMQVDDAVERIVAMLTSDPGLQRTEVVPEVDITRRLHARQHAGLGRRCCWIGHVRDDTAGLTAASVSFPQMVDVATPVYEGPFDLLLQLILKEQVDIYEINLSTIVDAYLVELERLAELDLDIATSFLLIAATLVDLKARRLLPNTGDIDLDDELALWEERDMLLARLLEAKTFKDVAGVGESVITVVSAFVGVDQDGIGVEVLVNGPHDVDVTEAFGLFEFDGTLLEEFEECKKAHNDVDPIGELRRETSERDLPNTG